MNKYSIIITRPSSILIYMIHIWQWLTDIIFPPSKPGLLIRPLSPDNFQLFYRPHKKGSVQILSEYHIPAVQAAITACKFENNLQATKLIGKLLNLWLVDQSAIDTVLIPIPLSYKRQKKRKHNQVERVLRTLPPLPFRYTICTEILTRTHDTKPQTSLNRQDRLKNMDHAFEVNKKQLKKISSYRRVVICDDVLTTGATLGAAKVALLPHLPPHTELICVCWAH